MPLSPYPDEIIAEMMEELAATVEDEVNGPFRPALSRNATKARRLSPPNLVMNNLDKESRKLYWILPDIEALHDGHAANPRVASKDSHPLFSTPEENPMSLYTILASKLNVLAESPDTEVVFTRRELRLLHGKGYTEADARAWMRCLTTSGSLEASALFTCDHHHTPLFVLLLYLRRRHIQSPALNTVMKHLNARLRAGHIEWAELQVLVLRLMRHVRKNWPEALPWIASLFSTEATWLYRQHMENRSPSAKFLTDLTRFCNSMLLLLSDPIAEHPLVYAMHQEKAQFIVLQFMDSCEPAITVTRRGFQGTVRVQLRHAKTAQEKEWALLKGPSWPPWKENRNAMDEDKGYTFGASRASRLLHRLYEAGYGRREWEQIAEVYAGWDTDMSPTIQTRTNLALDRPNKARLWAARIRATRTRREAWACFLAWEDLNTGDSSLVYLAMFEKLHYQEVQVQTCEDTDAQAPGITTGPFPGDMREVLPDPKSPLNLIHLSEPVPSYGQLYRRMWRKKIRPKKTLLTFLLETLPELDTCIHLLQATETKFGGGVIMLLKGGLPLPQEARLCIPEPFLKSFVHLLCRFGIFDGVPPETPLIYVSRGDHIKRIKHDRRYLIDFAYAILMHLHPTHRPTWTIYMKKIVYGPRGIKKTQEMYTAILRIFEQMEKMDMDPDNAQFMLLCNAVRYTADEAYNRRLSRQTTQNVLTRSPSFLRKTFYKLVGTNADEGLASSDRDMSLILPHVPSPETLHTYVRALGSLRDFEGLYSFSLWLTTYHKEVTIRANGKRGGAKLLHKTLCALRAALEGRLEERKDMGAPLELVELVKARVETIKGWSWPSEEDASLYSNSVSGGRRR